MMSGKWSVVAVCSLGRAFAYSCVASFVFLSTLFISCHNEPTPEELASLAAKGYYEHLAKGEYDAYLEGVNGVAAAPADYREQLLQGTKLYVERVNRQFQGIHSVEVSSARVDSTLHCVNVFLTICFRDSTREEVCVPMVEKNGAFLMR